MVVVRWLLTVLLVHVLCAGVEASDWTEADTAREVAYLALHVMDWGQTLDIADHPERFYERNPVLGRHPSRGDVNRYFIITGLLHPVVSYMLPRGWRDGWQYVTIGVEVGCVGANARLGVGFGF